MKYANKNVFLVDFSCFYQIKFAALRTRDLRHFDNQAAKNGEKLQNYGEKFVYIQKKS